VEAAGKCRPPSGCRHRPGGARGAFAWWQDRQAGTGGPSVSARRRTSGPRPSGPSARPLEEAVGPVRPGPRGRTRPRAVAEARAAARHAEAQGGPRRTRRPNRPGPAPPASWRRSSSREERPPRRRHCWRSRRAWGTASPRAGTRTSRGGRPYARAFQEYGTDLLAVAPEAGADLLRNLGGDVRVRTGGGPRRLGYVRYFGQGTSRTWPASSR